MENLVYSIQPEHEEIPVPQEEMVQAHAYISGRVQGVNFRYYTRQHALNLGLTGWVRNVRDGRVEAIFCGKKEQVAKMLKWCEEGPPAARVDNVQVEWEQPADPLLGFDIRFWGG
jgi:acylphosphatase